MQTFEFVEAERMHFIGGHGRRRRRLQCPAIELIAMRPCPHACVIRRRFSRPLEFVDLTLQRRDNVTRGDGTGLAVPVTGYVFRPSHERFDQRAALVRAFRGKTQLRQGLVDQECGRNESGLARRA